MDMPGHDMAYAGVCHGICRGMPWHLPGHAMAYAVVCHGLCQGMPWHMPGVCHGMPWHMPSCIISVPEMIWVKNRSANNDDWFVYHSALGNTKWLELNTTAAEQTHQAAWNNTSPTATQFTVGAYNGVNGSSGYHYIAYLFATVAGVSKVGSYTGNATSDRVIDCGFSNGARFVLIKDTSQTGPGWQVFDAARGITSTKAELLRLNLTNAQIPNGSPTQDYHNLIEPDSSGFKLNHTAALQVNASGINYIFYAIAQSDQDNKSTDERSIN